MEDDMAEKRAIDKRIDRMEVKIDKLIDAVTELVRVEVVLQTIETRLNAQSRSINSLDGRLDIIETKVPIYDIGVNMMNRIAAVFVTVLVTGLVGSLFVFTN